MRPRFVWTVTLLAGWSAAVPAQRRDPARDSMYNRALSAWQLNELPTAKAILDSVIARDPQYASAWAVRAGVRRFMGDVAGADSDWTAVIRLEPNQWGNYRSRGELRQAIGDPRAKDDLDRANLLRAVAESLAQANPSPQRLDSMSGRIYATNMHRLRADSAVKRGDTAAARIGYDAALAADPRNFVVYFERGVFRYNQADTAGARRDFTRAAELGDIRAQSVLQDKNMWENPPLPPAQRAQAEREDSVRRAAPFVPPPPQAQPWTLERASSAIAASLPSRQVLVGLAVLLGAAMALFALWYQMTPAPRIVEFPKLKDERHVWIGAPRQGLFIQAQHVGGFLFGLAWCSFVYYWEKTAVEIAIQNGDAFSWFFVLFGVPFVLVGVYLLVGQPFADARRRKITTYALTSQRVLLSVGKKLNSRALDRLEEPTLIEHRDGTGTITLEAKVDAADFEKVMTVMKEGPLKHALGAKRGSLSDIAAFSPKRGRRGTGGAQFERIPDAHRVYKMMLEAMAPAQGGDLPSASASTRTPTT